MAAAGAPWSWMVHALIAALILGAKGNQDLSVCTQANRAGEGGGGPGSCQGLCDPGGPRVTSYGHQGRVTVNLHL